MKKFIKDTSYTHKKYIVDIGASSGVPTDPCFPFITNNEYSGLCIEGNKHKIKQLRKNISSKMQISNSFITPENVLSIFEKYNVPTDLFLIKIDIDGYDLEIIRKILSSDYKPVLFIAEINEKIPPPINFEVLYTVDYQWDCSHFFGFSLQSGKNVFESNDYFVVKLYEMNNILCVRKDQKHLFSEYSFPREITDIYQKEYVNNNLRKSTFPWNKDVDHWLDIKDNQNLKESIETYFTKNNVRSKFKNKSKILDKDFLLYY